MPQWADRIRGHQLNSDVEALSQTLDQAQQQLSADPEVLAAFDRLRLINDLVRRRLHSVDPNLLHPAYLNNISQYTQQQLAEIRAFLTNANAQHIHTANNHADNVLAQVPNLLPPVGVTDLPEVSQAVSAFRDLVADRLSSVNSQTVQLAQKLEQLDARSQELTNEVASQKGRLDAAIAQVQQQFAQSEDTRRAQFAESEQRRLEAGSQSDDDRKKAFREFMNTATETVDQTVKIGEENLRAVRDQLSIEAAEVLGVLEEQKSRAAKIVGLISESGMIHGYQRVANAEQRSARNWHLVAAASLVGLIGFAVYAFIGTLATSFTWPSFAGRVFVALTFGILGAYAARQADKHEVVERRSRRLELELAALDPFLEPLPESERHEVKKRLADRLFGQHSEPASPNPNDVTTSVVDLLRLAIQALSKK